MAVERKALKVPAKLGACADLLFTLRAERLALQAQADAIKEDEVKLREHIIATLPKSEALGVVGKLARVTITRMTVPKVDDWPALYAFIARTKSFDLLTRRISDAAVKARWEDRKDVPGVTGIEVENLSINKL